jgi:hypothetical protein
MQVITSFLGLAPDDTSLRITRDLPAYQEGPAKIHKYKFERSSTDPSAITSGYITVDTVRLYVLGANLEYPQAAGTGPELPLDKLRPVAEQFMEVHYPGMIKAQGLSLQDAQMEPMNALFLWGPPPHQDCTGARAGVFLDKHTGQVLFCGVYIPPPHPLPPKIKQSDAEQTALKALRQTGMEITLLESHLCGAFLFAPNEGPVWVVVVHTKTTGTHTYEEDDQALVDAVNGDLLFPQLRPGG